MRSKSNGAAGERNGNYGDTELLRVGFPQIKCVLCFIKCMNILGI